jgi:hypothetical protein
MTLNSDEQMVAPAGDRVDTAESQRVGRWSLTMAYWAMFWLYIAVAAQFAVGKPLPFAICWRPEPDGNAHHQIRWESRALTLCSIWRHRQEGEASRAFTAPEWPNCASASSPGLPEASGEVDMKVRSTATRTSVSIAYVVQCGLLGPTRTDTSPRRCRSSHWATTPSTSRCARTSGSPRPTPSMPTFTSPRYRAGQDHPIRGADSPHQRTRRPKIDDFTDTVDRGLSAAGLRTQTFIAPSTWLHGASNNASQHLTPALRVLRTGRYRRCAVGPAGFGVKLRRGCQSWKAYSEALCPVSRRGARGVDRNTPRWTPL